MADDKRSRLKQWLASGEAALHPQTFPQRELWEVSPVPPGDMANHIACLIKVRGAITPQDCIAAIQKVVDRQDVLRLSFLPGKDRPLQMIRRTGEPIFTHRVLKGADATSDGVEERAREVFRAPFDMVLGPLYRVELLHLGDDQHVLVFAIHHSIADGWTLGVFVQDLCAAYIQGAKKIPGPLPAVPQTYPAWGAAERESWPQELEKRLAFWKPRLAGSPRIWGTNAPAEGESYAPARWVAHAPLEIANGARELARRTGTTLFSTLLAVFQAALAKWAGAHDFVVGSPVANRNKPAVRETMGYFSGVVPLRGQVDPGRKFTDHLRITHENTLDCLENAMPFVELAHALGEKPAPGYHPVYEIRFALQNHPIPDVDLPGLSARLRMRSTGTARFHLGCEVTEQSDGFELAWLFRQSMFEAKDMVELDRLFQGALASACGAPDTRLSELT